MFWLFWVSFHTHAHTHITRGNTTINKMTSKLRVLLMAGNSKCIPMADTLLDEFHARMHNMVIVEFLQFSKKARAQDNWFIKVYAVLAWIVSCKGAQTFALEKDHRRDRFMRMLQRDIVFHLHGLRPHGGMYKHSDKVLIQSRRLQEWVCTMQSVYRML